MSKTSKLFLLILSAVLVLFTIGGGLAVKASSNQGAYPQLGVYSEAVSRIRSEYVEEPNMSAVSDGALHGLPFSFPIGRSRSSRVKRATG